MKYEKLEYPAIIKLVTSSKIPKCKLIITRDTSGILEDVLLFLDNIVSLPIL